MSSKNYMAMKRLNLLFAFSLLAVLVQAMVYTPTSLPNPKAQDIRNYICNPDEIVASNEVLFLNRLAQQLEDSTQVELCVVAVNSIGEIDAFDFCYEVFSVGVLARRVKTRVYCCFWQLSRAMYAS